MAKENKEKEPKIVFWTIVGVGVAYMYFNLFKKKT